MKNKDGDPNINRFTLAPLLDAILTAQSMKDYPSEISSWREKALKAADFQYSVYQNQVPWDWVAKSYKKYPNQDVYYLLICALANKLGGDEKFQYDEQGTLEGLENQLMPGGGWHYIADETESPVYHYITESILSRYVLLTGSARAYAILEASTRYWLKILSKTGQPSYTSDPWWKQFWQPIPKSAIQLAASINQDRKLIEILGLDEKYFSKESGVSSQYIYAWLNSEATDKKIGHGFSYDIDAQRYYSDENYFHTDLVAGHGLRNTFVGVRYCGNKKNTDCAVVRAVTPEIESADKKTSLLFLSQPDDRSKFKETPNGVAYAVAYKAQPALINGTPKLIGVDSEFKIQQIWYAQTAGIVGVVSIQALKAITTASANIKIALGPTSITTKLDGKTYTSDGLIVKVFQSFGKSSVAPDKRISPAMWPHWSVIQQGLTEPTAWKAGEKKYVTLWIGHHDDKIPESAAYAPESNTLRVTYSKLTVETQYVENNNFIRMSENIKN